MTLTAIARDFGRSDADIAFSLTLTLAFRPVGAFVFGLIADRYGRKLPLMADLVFYSAIEVLSGLAPSYASFLVLRALFGIGMGGEWGVGASLVMEKVPPRLRGVVSGLLQQGYAAGYLLAALCYFFVFPRWGWRPLFFIGGLPALLALFVRARVKESDVWRETRQETWRGLGRAIVSNWKLFLYLVPFDGDRAVVQPDLCAIGHRSAASVGGGQLNESGGHQIWRDDECLGGGRIAAINRQLAFSIRQSGLVLVRRRRLRDSCSLGRDGCLRRCARFGLCGRLTRLRLGRGRLLALHCSDFALERNHARHSGARVFYR